MNFEAIDLADLGRMTMMEDKEVLSTFKDIMFAIVITLFPWFDTFLTNLAYICRQRSDQWFPHLVIMLP